MALSFINGLVKILLTILAFFFKPVGWVLSSFNRSRKDYYKSERFRKKYNADRKRRFKFNDEYY